MRPAMKPPTRLLLIFVVVACTFVVATSLFSQTTDPEPGLRQTVERFMHAVDVGDTKTVASMYDPTFTNVRVADDGGVVRLTRDQMLQFLGRAPANAIPTKDTTIH